MDREGFSIKDPSIDELTTQAMQLLHASLGDLYAVLGFQLTGYSRPARLATIISYHTNLQKIVEAENLQASLTITPPHRDLSRSLDVVYEDLKQEGAQFVSAVREDLCKVLCTPETLDLAHRATAASMRVMLLMIAGALRMPPQTESLAATLGAIIYKSGLKDFCEVQTTKN
jgi:hypothetical protein